MSIVQQRLIQQRPIATTHAQAVRRFLEIELAGQLYGIPLAQVQEVVAMARLSGPPDLPAVLAGFLNFEGIAIPVLRLDRLFRLPEQPPGLYTPLILLRGLDSGLALMVEGVRRIRVVAAQAVLPLPENHSFNDCVDGMVTDDDRVLLLLAPARLLLEKEQQCLAEWQDREQSRLRACRRPGREPAVQRSGLFAAQGPRDRRHRPGVLRR